MLVCKAYNGRVVQQWLAETLAALPEYMARKDNRTSIVALAMRLVLCTQSSFSCNLLVHGVRGGASLSCSCYACMHAHMNDSCAIRLCHDWSQLPALAFVFQSSGNLFNMFMHVHMKVLYI